MSISALVLALFGAASLLFAGYALGARRGRAARAGLRGQVAHLEAELRKERDRHNQSSRAKAGEVVQAEIAAAVRPLIERDSVVQKAIEQGLQQITSTLTEQQRADGELLHRLRADMVRLLPEERNGASAIESQMGRLLQPLLEREQLGTSLAQLGATIHDATALPEVLDAIAKAGGFSTVLISDEVGLPLATNQGGRDPETHAGISSLLLTLFDRVVANEQPRPIAAVFRDEAQRTILHRVFANRGSRFVLTAVNTGQPVYPETLDPVLVSLERMLNRQRWSP